MRAELKRAALLVIDMQGDFVRPGPLVVPGAAELAARLAPLVRRWRACELPVVFVRHALRGPDAGPLAELEPVRTGRVLREESAGSQVVPELAPQPGDLFVTKRRFSAFVGTDLDMLLRSMGIGSVVIAGTATHVCCDSTARDAAQLGYGVVVLSDGTAMGDLPDVGFGPFAAELVQRVVLSILARRFADVCTISELLTALGRSECAARGYGEMSQDDSKSAAIQDASRDGAGSRVRTGSAFERLASYSRAARLGDLIAVSGTAAVSQNGEALHPGDAYRQTKAALELALAAAQELGARRERVVRTRLFLAPDCDWQEAVKAHNEMFQGVDPANTTLFVAGLIPPGCVVEVELDAVRE